MNKKESYFSASWKKGNSNIDQQNIIISDKEKILLENYKFGNADNENYSTFSVRKDYP